MKTAEERAREVWLELPAGVAALMDREGWVRAVTRSFKEYGRDQRHITAEREGAQFSSYGAPVKDPGDLELEIGNLRSRADALLTQAYAAQRCHEDPWSHTRPDVLARFGYSRGFFYSHARAWAADRSGEPEQAHAYAAWYAGEYSEDGDPPAHPLAWAVFRGEEKAQRDPSTVQCDGSPVRRY